MYALDKQAHFLAGYAIAITLALVNPVAGVLAAVAVKGDKARIHVGIIAQEVIEAFSAEGLDANNYALLCYDAWDEKPEVRQDDGTVLIPYQEAGNRYGIRYSELLAFIIATL